MDSFTVLVCVPLSLKTTQTLFLLQSDLDYPYMVWTLYRANNFGGQLLCRPLQIPLSINRQIIKKNWREQNLWFRSSSILQLSSILRLSSTLTLSSILRLPFLQGCLSCKIIFSLYVQLICYSIWQDKLSNIHDSWQSKYYLIIVF